MCTDVVFKCTIDAQASFADPRRVIRLEDANDISLVGLVIKGGYRNDARDGGGILSYNSVLTLSSCEFRDNYIGDNGGGM
jgi:hypothetical protein